MQYKEILKLKEMLEEANIPFTFNDDFFSIDELGKTEYSHMYPAYQIIINDKDGNRLCDAIEHYGSYGNKLDLIEIMNALTEEEYKSDSVLGYLSAEEVFKRFKYCYENNTTIYKKEGD